MVNQNISIQHSATALQSKIVINLSSKHPVGINEVVCRVSLCSDRVSLK